MPVRPLHSLAGPAGAVALLLLATSASAIVWPISGSSAVNADAVEEPYGPRWIGRYDFHAGLDLDASIGTPVRSVMAGTVLRVTQWDGESTAGTNILISHGNNQFTAYLHLNETNVVAGQQVNEGQTIATAGDTGAEAPHLHFTYMVGLTGTSNDERKSRNPLEILPYSAVTSIANATIRDADTIRIRPSLQRMTIKSITLSGQGQSRTIDYYSIVSQGSTARDTQLQNDIFVATANPSGGTFPLDLSTSAFKIENIVVKDFNGATLLNQDFENTWNVNASSQWELGTNWTTFNAPDWTTAKVRLGGAIGAPRTISLNSTVQADRLTFENLNRYTISGAGTLELAGPSATGISVVSGSHAIALDGSLRLAKNVTTIDVAGGATLFAQTTIAAADPLVHSLRKSGNGTLNVYSVDVNGLDVAAGRLAVDSASPGRTIVTRSLTIGATGTLDIGDGLLAVDYAGGSAAPLDALRNLILRGRNGGDWLGAGLTASNIAAGDAIGYAPIEDVAPSVVSNAGILAGDVSAVFARVTRRGDANLDRVVNFDDLLALAQNYGTLSGAHWSRGDFDYSGAVDFDDLLVLTQNYSASAEQFASDWALAQSIVPEPTTLSGLALLALHTRRRRPQ